MLQNYNSKEKKESTQSLQPKASEQKNIPEPSFIKICLETKKNSHRNKDIKKPKKASKINVQNSVPNENIISTAEIHLNSSTKIGEGKDIKFQEGPWTNEEHEKFIEGILKFGNKWKIIQEIIKTRNSTQVRSHAQKFFKKIKNLIMRQKENIDINEKIKLINNIFNLILPNKKVNKLDKNQKKKLLSAIFCNINLDGNLGLDCFAEVDLDALENSKSKNQNNENNIINKNNKISLNLLNLNSKKNLSKKNILLGEKRKLAQTIETKDKTPSSKKEASRRPSFDNNFYKLNDRDNNDSLNELLDLCEDDITIQRNANNHEFIRKNSINTNNNNNMNNNYENNFVINNYINITNNIINNKIEYNIFNQEIFNNNSNHDLFNNDKIDSIYNEKIQYFLENSQTQEKCNFNDKLFLNGSQINKFLNNDYNQINFKVNNYNEIENNNYEVDPLDPFQLNFKDFSNENLFNENERQISIREYDLI